MSSPLAIHGGPPVLRTMAPQVPWPPIDINTAVAVTAQLYNAVSLPGRTGVVAELEIRLAEFFGVRTRSSPRPAPRRCTPPTRRSASPTVTR